MPDIYNYILSVAFVHVLCSTHSKSCCMWLRGKPEFWINWQILMKIVK